MVDSIHSGYKEAAQSVTWASGRSLVSLAIDEYTDESDAIDNSSLLYLFADWEFVCTSVAFDATPFDLFIIPSVDGTNYAAWTGDGVVAEPENDAHFVGSFTGTGTTSAQYCTLRNVAMPPGLFKVGFRNRGGIALDSTGSTLKFRRWGYASR